MITSVELMIILSIGVLMAAWGSIAVAKPAWFWALLMGRRWAMAGRFEQATPELRQPIFVLGARVLGGIMLIAGLAIAVIATWS
ncbi:hypothetical protein [Nitrolancea hollandica]|uniref:Uncharacterized protein n=1 Tax=Nitrolancea hollandica Lb TaxID=1129897 RepID=I4EFD7_9BACT|nr:hypothetical protein [Nitrolancea hollandica]CCF83399.1 exported hypothetical protein [Nitrolancea hollandica Lb]